jgi:hypothetical protein
MKLKIIIFSALLASLGGIVSYHSPSAEHPNNPTTPTYAVTFNSAYHDKILLLGCMVYAKSATNKLQVDSNADFEGIAGKFVASINPDKNIDICLHYPQTKATA